MTMRGTEAHWDNVHKSKRETEVSWFEDTPARSMKLLGAAGLAPGVAAVDVGGGAFRLVDAPARLGNVDDRAAFHFLTAAEDRHAYAGVMAKALKPGCKAVISTFDKNGPETCSGLPVMRYEGTSLA